MHEKIAPEKVSAQRRRTTQALAWAVLCLLTLSLSSSCTKNHYHRSADKEVYKIIQQKEKRVLGHTNAFSIDTRYSNRKPDDISSKEIIEDRMRETKQTLTLQDALRLALENSRQYQLRKEQLYLSAPTVLLCAPSFFGAPRSTRRRHADGNKTLSRRQPTNC